MSILLNPQLSCFEALKSEYPAQVVETQADGRDIKAFSSLKIGVINLMPTKEATERQWSRLMVKSQHWIEPVWIQMGSYQSRHTSEIYLESLYKASDAVDLTKLEGVILTGAPVEHLAFEAVAYWAELDKFLDEITIANIPVLAVCWGAQALLYKRYGLLKHPLGEKCFGIFEHQIQKEHPMTAALNASVFLPHSRHTGWRKEELESSQALNILIESEAAGVFALEDREGDWFWSGHPEYETDTLLGEYHRDLEKGQTIAIPNGYLKTADNQWRTELTWEDSAQRLLHNWIDEIAPRRVGFITHK